MHTPFKLRTKFLLSACIAGLLTACGGGSGDGSTATSASSGTTISGNVVKGPVTGATVSVKNAATGALLGSTTTVADGAYSLAVPFSGDVIVEVLGGTYTDEATAATTALTSPLKTVLNATGSKVTGMVTPLTTMAFNQAFPKAGAAISAAAYNAMASDLAAQFKLTGVNLTTTLPAVSGSVNDYGRALTGLSKYLQLNNATLQSLVGTALTSPQWAQLSDKFTSAFKAAHPGSAVTYAFNGNVLTLGGTGLGGGAGTCGVDVKGSVTVGAQSVPLALNYCITGLAVASCSGADAVLSKALAAQTAMAGAVNLTYTFSTTCAPGALNINLP